MAKITQDKLLRILIESKLISEEHARDCVEVQKKTQELGLKQNVLDIAIQKGYLPENQKKEALRLAALAAEDRPAVRIPGYEIENKIGQGGMGIVYKGKQISLDRPVAVKVLAKRLAEDSVFVKRFLREAKSAAKIDSPHVVRAIDAGEAHGTYYFVMEYVPGQTVSNILKQQGALPEDKALRIVEHVADALTHAENVGIVHRDVKPDNIMVTPDGTAKLSDLGLAKEILDSSVTMAGKIIGTPYYMSPEQIEGTETLDIRSDIYSLGATLYQMLTNEYPFRSTSPTGVIAKHLRDPRPDPASKNPNVSGPTSSLVRRMMACDRLQRPKDAAELKKMVVHCRRALKTRRPAGAAVDRGPGDPQNSRTLSVPVIIGGAAALFAIALTLIIVLGRSSEPESFPEEPAVVAVNDAPEAVVPPASPPPTMPVPDHPAEAPETPREPPTAAEEPSPAEPSPNTGKIREMEAQKMFSNARHVKFTNPRNPLAALDLLNEIAKKYPTTNAGTMASLEAGRIKAGVDNLLAKAKNTAQKARAASDFKTAEMAFVQFLDRISENPWKTSADKELQSIRKESQEVFQKVLKKADELVSAGKHTQAHRILMRATEKVSVDVAKTAAKPLKTIEKARQTAEKKREKDKVLVAEARDQALDHLQKGNFSAMIRTYETLQRTPRFSGVKSLIAKELEEFKRVESILEKAEKKASTSIGKDFSIKGIAGTISGVEDGRIRIKSGGAEFSQPLWELKTSEILELAALGADGSGDPLGVAMLYISRGKTEEAGRILEKQEDKGTRVATHMSLLDDMEKRLAEKKAGVLIASVKKLAASRKWSRAYEALETLRNEYPNTRTFAAAGQAINALEPVIEREALRAEEKKTGSVASRGGKHIPGMAGLVRRVAGPNAFRVDYSFEDEAQLGDWKESGSGSGSGKKKWWSVHDGHLIGKNYSGIENKIHFVGDISVDTKVAGSSNFVVHIGEYSFRWNSYSSIYGVNGISASVSKQGIIMPGGENYLYNAPLEMIPMRWTRKGKTLTWYWGSKKVLKVKDKGTLNKNSTVRIESSSYYSSSSSYYSSGSGRRVEMDDLRLYGMVDATWLDELRNKPAVE